MVRRVGLGEDDVLEGLLWVEAEPRSHLLYPLGAESVLGVYVERPAPEASLLGGQLDGDAELLADLGLARPELAVELRDGLRLDAPAQ
ncbi:hypothetical protein ES703_98605 [subsurface metagenome]